MVPVFGSMHCDISSSPGIKQKVTSFNDHSKCNENKVCINCYFTYQLTNKIKKLKENKKFKM